MPSFRDLRVKHKITAITLITILVVSLLSSIVYVAVESRRARSAVADELTTIAGIVADNSTAALVFNDPAAAEETLAALKAKPDIVGASIFRRDGSLFASYADGASDGGSTNTKAARNPRRAASVDALRPVRGEQLELTLPIRLDGEVVGTLVLKSSLARITAALWTYVGIVLAVMAISMLFAFALISRLQRVISTPIERLLKTMESVSASQDYTVRAQPNGRDELGSLINGFNDMLAQIQRHEEVLHGARHQAESASRAKSDFLANMSHELRTPLNAILGFSEVLMNEMVGPLGQPRYREYAFDIHDSGQHLLALINDILDLSKVEARRVELVDNVIDVGALVEKAVRLVADRAEQAKVEIRVLAAPDLPKLVADERLVKQALLNLVSNSVKFTPEGGRVDITLSLAADGSFRLGVRDTGIGIAEPDLERVLTPFFQVESALSRQFQGTGLGLPLTKSFIEMHGGRFELNSRLGEGTEVTLRFPATRVHRPQAIPTADAKPALSA